MFELIHAAGNTYCLRCFSNIGVYHMGDGTVILIDAGDHKKSVKDLITALDERNWKVRAIYCTHSHLDHIAGNITLKEKYGCDIYASEKEDFYGKHPQIDVAQIFNAIPVKLNPASALHNPGTETKLLSKDIMPEGFDIIDLPGHTFNMVGIKTPDDVWFLGDAVLARETFESYKIPYFFNINKSIETAEAVSQLEGKLFIPSHDKPYEDISDLALYNANRLRELKEYILSICNGRSFEEILQKADEDLALNFNLEKYARVQVTVRSLLQALISDGRVSAEIQGGKLLYNVE